MKKRCGFIYVDRDETDLKDLKRYKKKVMIGLKKLLQTTEKFLSNKCVALINGRIR